MVIARIESFIVGKGLDDALKRAEIYSKAGADAILIHSKENTPAEIFSFAEKFKKSKYFKPLVCVPSTYQDQQKRVAATHVSRGCDVSPFQATSPTVKLI